MKALFRSIVLVTILIPLFSSCAAMFSGTRTEIKFSSLPFDGTKVIVGDQEYHSGSSVDISKWTKSVTFVHPKYGARVVPITRNLKWNYIVMDVLFTPGFGLIGLTVDASTAAWFEMPERISYNFKSRGLREKFGKEVLESRVRPKAKQPESGEH